MASSSGTSSGSSLLQNSGSEEDLQAVMDQRKRKRMISNRESARRSRMRKQKHLDDLVSQVAQLRKENQQILTSVNITTQQYLSVEAENSVLRAQVGELSHRLESLNEIVDVLNATTVAGFGAAATSSTFVEPMNNNNNSFFNFNPLNMGYLNHPIMASADILQY
ncbi:Ocs element-binding factor 1 [Glycine soja]|nr:Ocs element-binding factor 1 [Glycine soja]